MLESEVSLIQFYLSLGWITAHDSLKTIDLLTAKLSFILEKTKKKILVIKKITWFFNELKERWACLQFSIH